MAGPSSGPTPLPQSTEVMLYVSVPLGSGNKGFKLPNLSLRVGQTRMGGNSGSPVAGDPMQHRELLRLEVAGRQRDPTLDMRVELGARVTYDLKRGVFGLRADNWKRPSLTSVPGSGLNASAFQKRLLPHLPEYNGTKRDIPISAHLSLPLARDVPAAVAPRR
jgi:hypothetical protein